MPDDLPTPTHPTPAAPMPDIAASPPAAVAVPAPAPTDAATTDAATVDAATADDGAVVAEAASAASGEPAAATALTPAAATTAAVIADLPPAACAARLAALFPALFGRGAAKPLKLRIQADIQQRAPGIFTRKSLSTFLHRHTTSTPYLIALSQSPLRFDLDGAPAGDLAAEHREAAATELARRRGLHEARRAAENAARRDAEAQARQAHAAEHDARRERAALLRAFETTTLTPANFCALKGMDDTALQAALAQARLEREPRPPEPRHDHRPEHRHDPRRDARPHADRDRDPRRPRGPRDDRGPRPPQRPAPR